MNVLLSAVLQVTELLCMRWDEGMSEFSRAHFRATREFLIEGMKKSLKNFNQKSLKNSVSTEQLPSAVI